MYFQNKYPQYQQPVSWKPTFDNSVFKISATKQTVQAKVNALEEKNNNFTKKIHKVTHDILFNKKKEISQVWVDLAKEFIKDGYLNLPLELMVLRPEQLRAEFEQTKAKYPDYYSPSSLKDNEARIQQATLLKQKAKALLNN
ncbi:MAG: hypothetical protein RLZ12_532 [Bacillota bacterium]|jgi:hypothetical protein